MCETSLAEVESVIAVGEYLRLGHGELMTGGKARASLLADVFEALTGASFLDGGFDEAKAFLERTLIADVEKRGPLEDLYKDDKTLLKEYIQKDSQEPLVYEVRGEEGPDHDKHFCVAVHHASCVLGRGIGKSKKEAEQNAAKNALAGATRKR